MRHFIAAGSVIRPVACLVTGILVAGTLSAVAQDPKKPAPAASTQTWAQTVSKDTGSAGVTLDDKQVETVKKVNAYFNELINLKGTFVQTSADNKRLRGKFYVQRPGKFRFDYSLPSKMIIISDGQQLAIQDTDIGSDDRLQLDQTPFRMLLRKDVDIIRDARIGEVQEADDLIVVSLRDKSPDTPGAIRLFLVKKPGLELKEWVTTDAQGLDTRVEVAELNKTEAIDSGLFKPESLKLKDLQKSNN